ncbi:MAG: hypothetical protein Tsb0020_35950 [Haliangiales bacterium]
MALAHTPLDPKSLGPDAQRALASDGARMMAARGLAPISRPRDLLALLYQLAVEGDQAVRDAAKKTASELPDALLVGAVEDPALDPRVLDHIAPRLADKPGLMQRLILNPATADETIAEIARRTSPELLDLIAQNEQRLLASPAIIAAMYKNPRARMSTVDRAIELAVRNQLTVADIPAWDDLVAAVLGKVKDPNAGRSSAENDELFANVASRLSADQPGAEGEASTKASADASAPEQEEEKQADVPINRLNIPSKIRLATLGNAFHRSTLIRDSVKMVAVAAIKAPGVTDSEAAKYAGNHALCDDVINYIANRRDWTKLYTIKLSLVQNPKTPIQTSIRFMSHLREKDLRGISRSKSIPTAVAAQARKLLSARQQRSGGGRK